MKFKTNLMRRMLGMLLVSILFVGCSPEDGKNGTDGIDGIDGVDGIDGIDGNDGTDGETGTANVIYSDWVNTELSNSIASSSASFTIDAPEIDPDILNFGTILVYARRIAGGNIVYQLPIVFGASRQQSYFYRAEDETIIVFVASNEQGSSVGDGAFLEQYRYVIIPGGIASARPANDSTQVDYSSMSYEEIIALFNIPD